MGTKKFDDYEQGTYNPTNKNKYKGKGKPFYRSSYERRVFYWCDHNVNVVAWDKAQPLLVMF